jgi:hypothetical protein
LPAKHPVVAIAEAARILHARHNMLHHTLCEQTSDSFDVILRQLWQQAFQHFNKFIM